MTNLSKPTAPTPHAHAHKKNGIAAKLSYIGAIAAIIAMSFLFLYEFMYLSDIEPKVVLLIVFLVMFLMTQWSFFQASCSQAGAVLMHYGLSPQVANEQRNYCLTCHNFKPDRTHHCSSCGKCVLNMDHHCPWLKNCIGFHNRKFFILFLIYITLGLIFMLTIETIVMVRQIKHVAATNQTNIHFALKILLFLITLALTIVLIAFTKYHIDMVLQNTTSLQQLIMKRAHMYPDEQKIKNYNINPEENWQQVFGEDACFWALPIAGNGPKGNGTTWKQSYEPLPTADQRYDMDIREKAFDNTRSRL